MSNLLKYFFLLVAIVCINNVNEAQSQIIQRDLLSHYTKQDIEKSLIPSLQWHPFPQGQKEWKTILTDTVREEIISKAEQFSKIPFESLPASVMLQYVRTGNRTNYEAISFAKRERLFSLALAESVEGKGRFSDAIIDGIWSICEESFWGVPAHLYLQKRGIGLVDVEDPVVDLFAGETAATLALVDYLVGTGLDSASSLMRQRIYYEVNRRVLEPLEKNTDRFAYLGTADKKRAINNWSPWVCSNWILSLLLLEKNEQRRITELHHAMVVMDNYLNRLPEDGVIDEGPAYWFEAIGKLFNGLNVIESATAGKIKLLKDWFVQQLASYIYKMHIDANYFISVADASPTLNPDGLMLYRFGKAVSDTNLEQFGIWFFQKNNNVFNHRFGQADQLWNLTVVRECREKKGVLPTLENVWLKGVQLMAARSSNKLFVASHGGHNAESHNHNDVGDVIIYAEGRPVIIDVGSGTYTSKTFSNERYTLWYNSSAYHNVPMINGFQQKEGRQYEAREVNYKESSIATTLQMDIAAAYPMEAGIKKWIRNVMMDKKLNQIIINDSYEAVGPLKQLSQSFITICPTDIAQPGKIIFDIEGKKYLMEYDAKKWEVKKEEVLKHTPDEKRIEDNWKKQIVWRILLVCKTPKAKDKFSYVFKKGS